MVISGHQRSDETAPTCDHQWPFWGNQWQSVGRSGGISAYVKDERLVGRSRNQSQSAIRAYVKGERLVGRSRVQTIRPVGLVEPARKEDGAAVELRARDGVHGAQVPVGSEAPW